MDELSVDTAAIAAVADALRTLREEFESCEDVSREAADAVGERSLADALHDFADDWTRSRRQIAEEMGELAAGAATLAEELERVDAELGAALTAGRATDGAAG